MKDILLKLGILTAAIVIVVLGVVLVRAKTQKVQNPIATIQIEGYDKPVKIELDPQSAPNTVANFIKLANNGFYNDYKMSIEANQIMSDVTNEKATLSKIKENPEGDFAYGIKADTLSNGVKNYIKHKKGVVTMINESYGYYEDLYNTANNTFSILTDDLDSYNEIYAGFGHVVDGMDVLEQISASRVEEKAENTENNAETNNEENAEEKNKITIKSITVDTFGVDYGVPEYVNYDELMKKFNSRQSY